MKSICRAVATALLVYSGVTAAVLSVVDPTNDVTYTGINRNGIEAFLNIPYGQDTSGENRFKRPRPYVPTRGSTVNGDSYGPACPQLLAASLPISLTNVSAISEDCLNLVVTRPEGTIATDRLPVMVYIYGGSLFTGQTAEITYTADGLVLESVENLLPVIHVIMNYRVGVFGFAQSDALKSEGSENAGLRDQRLAIEWVRDNIEIFGGDPGKITLFGQSSGGLSVGLQIMAYGGSKPVPFQRAICESQALEPGITGNYTIDAFQAVVDTSGCNKADLNSDSTVSCLRGLDMESLLNASVATYDYDGNINLGDIWLPAVDGDFLPAAPSELIKKGKFAKNITVMMGWCQDDTNIFLDTNITTEIDTRDFLTGYIPAISSNNVDTLLSLYPVSEFPADQTANLTSQFYRSARMLRDILMVCLPLYYAEHLAAAGSDIYLYNWNQTILDPILAYFGVPGLGKVHTSEFAYVFGNLSHYDTDGFPFEPIESDYQLMARGSRTWSTYASLGKPGLIGRNTFQGFTPAFATKNQTYIFVVGGSQEGLSAIDGPDANTAVSVQKLRERCAFINTPDMIEQLKY